MADPNEVGNVKEDLCVGRCSYQFAATKMVRKSLKDDEDNEVGEEEKVENGILFCQSCGHTVELGLLD
jgi:hypothetical protein